MRAYALLAAALGGLASPAWSQMPATSPTATAAEVARPAEAVAATASGDAAATLIRQARRWLREGRPDLAALSVQRLLDADPRNAEALVVAAQVEAARNNPVAARGYVTRLDQTTATPDQRAVADASARGAAVDRAAIEQARDLARGGLTEQAASRYRAIFGAAGPSPAYALEYYQALAAGAATHQEGAAGLARLAAAPDATDRARLANAQSLTYQPATRAEGTRLLAALAGNPALAEEATHAWRQALMFSGNDPAAVPQLEAYLATHQDAELARQLDATRTEAAGRTERARTTAGLDQALAGQGRFTQTSGPVANTARAAAGGSPTRNGAGPSAATVALRAEAARVGDANVAEALLRNAVAQSPDDPWTRLDLARILRRQDRAGEGRALVDELASRAGTPDADFAAALFADEDDRPTDAETLLGRIPPARRTTDMRRLLARSAAAAEMARAVAQLANGGGDARARLIALAARPDPSGVTAATAIRALGEAGDRAGAAEAARAAQAANPMATPTAQIAIAGALLTAGLEPEAGTLAKGIADNALTPDQRRDLEALRASFDIRDSDRLNEAGRQAEAFERLRPVISRSPDNPDGQLALARLYQNARKPQEALKIAEAVLARDPRNAEARRGAVEAAISLGDRRRAETLVAEAEALRPDDSRVTLLQARIARSFGDEARARVLLAQATTQRRAELGTTISGTALSASASPNPFAGAGVFQVATAVMPQDATSRDIAREAAAVRQETRPVAAVVPAFRARTGSGGLDKLDEYSTTAEATISPPGIDGRLAAILTAVTIDAGKLTGNSAMLNKFGTNAATGATATPTQTSAAGAGIGLVYTRADTVKVEVGTTPLGFPKATIVGGIEVAPRLSDNVRLRITAERRPVTDSLLSYAGTRDPVSGTRWGMVEHSGAHGQVEVGAGPGNLYAGGGYQVFDGTHVVSNQRVDAGTGYSFPIFKQPDAELSSGLDLIYLGYSKAVEGFTVGQGGYFSPQYFYAANIPLDYRGRSGDFTYHLGAIAGYAKWKEEASPLFPLDPLLQAQADAAARANPLILSHNQAQGRSGFTGGLRADGDYAITPTLKLSGGIAYDKAANWNETRVTIRLRSEF